MASNGSPICKKYLSILEADEVNRKEIDKVLEKMRYSDPVSSPAVATENEAIRQLILQLS